MLLVFIIFLNRVNNIYFTYLIDNWFSGKSYFEFKPDHIGILNGNLIVLVTAFMFAPLIFNFSIYAGKIMKLKKGQPLFVLFILLAVALNYQVFTQFVFPYVPDAIGGGKAPIVYIVFEENIPYEVSSNFDIGGRVAGFSSPYYYGQLVYMDNDSVFLREPFWFSSDVYEIRRSDIIMLSYREYNPVEMGQPGLFP